MKQEEQIYELWIPGINPKTASERKKILKKKN